MHGLNMEVYKMNAIIENKTKQERTYDEIKMAIIRCNFKPGDQLIIRGLASQLQVSEIPVREALKTLISENFVIEKKPNLYVAPISPYEFLNMLDVKIELEKLAIRLTAQRIDDEMLLYLCNEVDKMEMQYNVGNIEEYKQMHNDFHLSLCKMCGVSYLAKAIEDAFSHHIRGVNYFNLEIWEHSPSIEQHKEIVDALKLRDGSVAESCLIKNRIKATELYKKQMKKYIE